MLATFVVLVFVRIGYIYPSRTPQFRRLTVTLGIVWGIAIVAIIWLLPSPPAWLVYGSLAYPVYYGALSLYLHQQRARIVGPNFSSATNGATEVAPYGPTSDRRADPYDLRCASRPAQVSGSCASNVAK